MLSVKEPLIMRQFQSLISYSSESVHYYDECFGLPEKINGIYQIEVLLSASGGVTLEDALQNPIVKEFMDSLRKK